MEEGPIQGEWEGKMDRSSWWAGRRRGEGGQRGWGLLSRQILDIPAGLHSKRESQDSRDVEIPTEGPPLHMESEMLGDGVAGWCGVP